MLTSIYYYDFYKPYILNNDNKRNVQKNRFSGIKSKEYVQNGSNDSSSYFLNRADKNEIKSYVWNFSENVNGIKDTARYLQNVTKGKNARRDEGKSAYGDGLEDFVADYNSLVSFAEENNVSEDLKGFKSNIQKIVADNDGVFKELGVSADGDTLEFDRTQYEKLSRDTYKEKSKELNGAFADVYGQSLNVLSKPMANHLNFKNFDFYYNYSYTSKGTKPFHMLDTGFIVDISL